MIACTTAYYFTLSDYVIKTQAPRPKKINVTNGMEIYDAFIYSFCQLEENRFS